MKLRKDHYENLAYSDLEQMENSTGMYILGLRLGVGDEDVPVNHELACKLYLAATTLAPLGTDWGGHPIAMLHLALHYERGLGVEKDYQKAYQYYKRVTEHKLPGEEAVKHAFKALSRYHAVGLGGVEESKELSMKYLAFSMSNPESDEEIKHIERWWQSGGREVTMKEMETK